MASATITATTRCDLVIVPDVAPATWPPSLS